MESGPGILLILIFGFSISAVLGSLVGALKEHAYLGFCLGLFRARWEFSSPCCCRKPSVTTALWAVGLTVTGNSR